MSRVSGNIFVVILHKFSLRFLCSLPIDRNQRVTIHHALMSKKEKRRVRSPHSLNFYICFFVIVRPNQEIRIICNIIFFLKNIHHFCPSLKFSCFFVHVVIHNQIPLFKKFLCLRSVHTHFQRLCVVFGLLIYIAIGCLTELCSSHQLWLCNSAESDLIKPLTFSVIILYHRKGSLSSLFINFLPFLE